jgi:TPR repeat protein
VPANPGSPPPVQVGDDGEAADALARAAEIPPHLIQQALKDLGFHTGAIDGKIGTGTREAIRSFQKARGLTRTGELTHGQVVSLVRTAAEAGRAESQNTLGMMAAEGIGIPKDLEAAHHWFRTAAAQGNAHAAYNLGILFRDGRGVARSDSQARHYFELALADGLPRAREALEALDH